MNDSSEPRRPLDEDQFPLNAPDGIGGAEGAAFEAPQLNFVAKLPDHGAFSGGGAEGEAACCFISAFLP